MKSLASKILLLIAIAVMPTLAAAQDFRFEPPTNATDPALPAALRDLAQRIVPVYKDVVSDRYLANLAALQIVAGDPAAAHATRLSLQKRRLSEQRAPPSRAVVYNIYTQARAIEAGAARAFHKRICQGIPGYVESSRRSPRLQAGRRVHETDRAAAGNPPARARPATRRRAPSRSMKHSSSCRPGSRSRPIAVSAASYDRSLQKTKKGATSSKRSRSPLRRMRRSRRRWSVRGALPAPAHCRRCSSSRSIDRAGMRERPRPTATSSVLALARIVGDPKFRPRAPFESDGDDARAVIEWIAKQPWSDGRVGMQGAGYGGYVAWSAAKRPAAALKAIATSDPMAPGIGCADVQRDRAEFRLSLDLQNAGSAR